VLSELRGWDCFKAGLGMMGCFFEGLWQCLIQCVSVMLDTTSSDGYFMYTTFQQLILFPFHVCSDCNDVLLRFHAGCIMIS
jgi:hypothetical protein